MKKSIGILFIIIGLLAVSCTSYTHEKVVKNSSGETIDVVTGCCDQKEHYTIKPGESKVVFACIYQSRKKPNKDDLSWNVMIIKEDGSELQLDNPSLWTDKSSGDRVTYEYVVESETYATK